jgi:hypothetical protein
MKILVFVIVSFDKPIYYDMLQVWRERILPNDSVDVWFIQCKSDAEWIGDIVNDIRERSKAPFGCRRWNIEDVDSLMNPPLLGSAPLIHSQRSLRDCLELDNENKTLYVKGEECLIPGILHKTVEALSYFLSTDSTYTHVWRTNLSSVLDFVGLEKYLDTIPSTNFYGGYVGKAVNENIFFASGAGFLLSRDVAEYLVANKASLRYDLIDDVAIGAFLEPKFGIVPIDRCWVQTGEEDIEALLDQHVFHFRCESYQHLRTVEFMQYVSGKIIKKRCFPQLKKQ